MARRAKMWMEPHDAVELVVDGLTVTVRCERDRDGAQYVQLSGVDCELQGELPGLYYPVADPARGEDADATYPCPTCGSTLRKAPR